MPTQRLKREPSGFAQGGSLICLWRATTGCKQNEGAQRGRQKQQPAGAPFNPY